MKPLCFALMPFGQRLSPSGKLIDFDRVYQELIEPAILAANLDPLRAHEMMTGGVIHKTMFERLILCEYVVADITNVNTNVFYELGLRHAMRPARTVILFAKDTGLLPFDIAPMKALPYALNSNGSPANPVADKAELINRLEEASEVATDSPVYQLIKDFPAPDIRRLNTDVFRKKMLDSEALKKGLVAKRRQGLDAVRSVEQEMGKIADAEAGDVIDLFLSYRAVKGWQEMIDLVQKMTPPLAGTVMVQEQLGLALNRTGRGDEAEKILIDLIYKRGPSSETYGILGRVYKERWEAATQAGETIRAKDLLKKAIDAYLKGFEADWRDAYPGINAVTLMEAAEPTDPRQAKLLPVVAYAVEQRINAVKPDYWDYATLLELAVLAKDEEAATIALADALAAARELWEPETTARNLRLISNARKKRGELLGWEEEIEAALMDQASK